MIIERNRHLQKLIRSRKNGKVKIITGIRRCGKSYLLNHLFYDYLIRDGVSSSQIILLELENASNARYRNPLELGAYLESLTKDTSTEYYILLDEIQMVYSIQNPYLPSEEAAQITFVDVLSELRNKPNLDVYVTGSNSKMLSTDIESAFGDRGYTISISPLTYDEFYSAYQGDKRHAWREYWTYGGMPFIMTLQTHEEKAKYLQDLFSLTYLKDVIKRNHLKTNVETLDEILNVIASSVGSLTNPTRLANTFQSVKGIKIKSATVSAYLKYFAEAFIISSSLRYDIRGRVYINTPLKYYFTDIGLRNALLNFRQQEENHIMENILYNELKARGFSVDVGIVEYNHQSEDGRKLRTQLEVDFVVNKVEKRYYIQSALSVATEPKRLQETHSLSRIDDSYTKIVVMRDNVLPWTDESGIRYIPIEDFLLDTINKL